MWLCLQGRSYSCRHVDRSVYWTATLIGAKSSSDSACLMSHKHYTMLLLWKSPIARFVLHNTAKATHCVQEKKPRDKYCHTSHINTEHVVTQAEDASPTQEGL